MSDRGADHAANLPSFGRYQTLRLLGSGASGAVYAALDPETRCKVAIKVLRQVEDDPQERTRFLREAETARTIHHPNVVEYVDAGVAGDQLYLVTELLGAGDAGRLAVLYPHGMPSILIAAIGRDCARGLAALHAAHLIHRDIKPSNIFLGSTGLAKLGDLGLARDHERTTGLTLHGRLVGTPEFMAPEQALAEDELDHRADIWSLGATLYFLATGRAPFEAATAWAVLAQLINDPVPDPLHYNAELSPALAQIIRRATAKDRSQRYQTALALADDLERVLGGEPPGEPISLPVVSTQAVLPQGRRLLLIDDDPIIRRVYRTRLEQDGHTVDTAGTITEALALAAAAAPDLALLDLMLPDGDGLDLLRRLRALPGLAQLPVVVMSNAFVDEQPELARVAGVKRVLSKVGCTPRLVADLMRDLLTSPAIPAVEHGTTGQTRRAFVNTGDPSESTLARIADATSTRLRLLHRQLGEAHETSRLLALLPELSGCCRGAGAAAVMAGHEPIALLTQAIEQFGRQLCEWPDRVTPSAQLTLVQTMAALLNQLPRLGTVEPLGNSDALVVDDDPLAQRLACQALEKVRLLPIAVSNAQSALNLLDQRRFAVVVSDVMMEGMNGVQFAARLRAHPDHRLVPLVFITSLTDFKDRIGDLGNQRIDVIAKPFLLVELAAKALALLYAPTAAV